LSWLPAVGADTYSITRGVLGSLGSSDLGTCLANGVRGTSFTDTTPAPAGSGFGYLVQAQNYDCGVGSLGFDSSEQPRANGNAGACAGQQHMDRHAAAETAVFGTVSGSWSDTVTSNNVREQITEVLTTGG